MKSPIVIIGLFVAAFIIGIFWTWPSYQDYLKLTTQEQQLKQQVQSREKYFSNLASLQTQLQGSEGKLAKIDAAFPNDQDLPSLYEEIQQMAASSGLVLKTISSGVSPQTAIGTLIPIEVDVGLAGAYGGLKEFLTRSQTASRVLDVRSIGFASAKTGSQIDFSIKLNAYSY